MWRNTTPDTNINIFLNRKSKSVIIDGYKSHVGALWKTAINCFEPPHVLTGVHVDNRPCHHISLLIDLYVCRWLPQNLMSSSTSSSGRYPLTWSTHSVISYKLVPFNSKKPYNLKPRFPSRKLLVNKFPPFPQNAMFDGVVDGRTLAFSLPNFWLHVSLGRRHAKSWLFSVQLFSMSLQSLVIIIPRF